MPPRVSLLSSLRAINGTTTSAITTTSSSGAPTSALSAIRRAFSSTPADRASTVAQKRRHRDPYAIAQAKARKEANISRQRLLKTTRSESLGDPVRGITTPFIRSFDDAVPPPPTPQSTTQTHTVGRGDRVSPSSPNQPHASSEGNLNFFLNKEEVKQAVAHSALLLAPVPTFGQVLDEETVAKEKATREERHTTATEALNRIASLANGSSKDKLRVNIQRCISTFGRHTTDSSLPPKPAVAASIAPSVQLEKAPRAGPDTGSSEVQVAILTAKIKTLADFLESRGPTDKINKRNLRVLVHKRQKLLSYLRRKERGGPRWQNLIETLGLTEGTWRGEISL
ncbi:hypothetical protein AAFC00_006323 [Neodothiora populina]|uniref:Ribosomal protein S15 n=1 Tax=Neodothiora populina TaxID=2781224 RepID=A0ABR3P5K5_9PEZI